MPLTPVSTCTCTCVDAWAVENDSQDTTVKIVTLASPKNLNAMTVALGDAFREAMGSLSTLPPSELRAVVLTGEGRAFSAGGDLTFLEDRRVASPTSNALTMRAFYERFLSVRSVPVPVVRQPGTGEPRNLRICCLLAEPVPSSIPRCAGRVHQRACDRRRPMPGHGDRRAGHARPCQARLHVCRPGAAPGDGLHAHDRQRRGVILLI